MGVLIVQRCKKCVKMCKKEKRKKGVSLFLIICFYRHVV